MNENQIKRTVKALLRTEAPQISYAEFQSALAANNPLRNLTRKFLKTDDPVAQVPKYEEALYLAHKLLALYSALDFSDDGPLDSAYSAQDRQDTIARRQLQLQSQATALGLIYAQDPEDSET